MNIARTLLSSAVLALGLVATSPLAQAQERGQSWTVDVPFDFTVRHSDMHAGRYTVMPYGNFIFIQSQAGKTANALGSKSYTAQPLSKSSLVFQLVGEEYNLVQVKTMGSDSIFNTTPTRKAPRVHEAFNAPQSLEVMAVGTR